MTTTPEPASARSRAELARVIAAGGTPAWVMFWSHRPEPDGRIGAGCLSQWWPCRFLVDGTECASAEHWMMAGKARLFGDHDAEVRVLAAATPAEAKSLGRGVRGFDEQVWAQHRYELVVAGNVAKFGQNPALREFLSGTAGSVLVEASPRDGVWGIGLEAADTRATDPRRWLGENLLGFALMEARDRLAATGPTPDVAAVEALARARHAAQVDKAGRPYVEHLAAVAGGVAGAGGTAAQVAAAWLHDAVEDGALTRAELAELEVPEQTKRVVLAVTKTPGEPAEDYAARILAEPGARLVKQHDLAHNADPNRLAALDPATAERLTAKYAKMRRLLGLVE